MFWQACLDKNLFLLFLVSIVSYELAQAQQSTPASTTKGPRSTKYRYRGRYNKNYGSRNYGSGNMGGYYDDNGDYNYYKKTGSGGIDPRRLGTDIGDFGPVYDNQPAMSASMDIFIRWADDWLSDKTGNNYNGNNYNGNNYNRNNYNRNNNNGNNYNQNNDNQNNYNQNNNNGNNYNNNNYQKKRSYNRVRVPVRHYPDAKRSPIRRLPPLISILPGIPVFFDRITYQTLIFSPAGGVYIIPPVINFYGRRFAVAQLIKWGYASLVSSGVPPGPGLNVAPLVQPAPVGGPAVGFNSATGRFNGGIKMNSRNIGPQYPKRISKREIIDSEPSSGENYAPNSN